MSQTIDDFKDFYATDKTKERFDIATEIQSIVDLIHFGAIMITIEKRSTLEIVNYKNQFKQVLLNLLSNAKEALEQNAVKNPTITIMIDKHTIQISDNAGGIQEHNLHKIFEPYYTTKEKSSGIGLYMSKMIVEKKMGGSLSVKNEDSGATFTIMIADFLKI